MNEAGSPRKELEDEDNWDKFYREIDSCGVYRTDSETIPALLQDLRTLPIVHAENLEGGTQFKVMLTFDNGKTAIAKPMRLTRILISVVVT